MVESQTNQIISFLRKASKKENLVIPDGCFRRLRHILNNLETCKLPMPYAVIPGGKKISCVWQKPSRDLALEITPAGPLPFSSFIKQRDKDGDVVSTQRGDGIAVRPGNVDELMAWLLTEEAKEA